MRVSLVLLLLAAAVATAAADNNGWSKTCPENVQGCKRANKCTACHETCKFCQNLGAGYSFFLVFCFFFAPHLNNVVGITVLQKATTAALQTAFHAQSIACSTRNTRMAPVSASWKKVFGQGGFPPFFPTHSSKNKKQIQLFYFSEAFRDTCPRALKGCRPGNRFEWIRASMAAAHALDWQVRGLHPQLPLLPRPCQGMRS
jgi:hypothetical protein